MPENRIRLVTRGDDLGSCNTAAVAIWNAWRRGILRNSSVMVPAPCFPEAAQMFAEAEGLCIGLHATLTAEWDNVRWGPVLPGEEVPSLVDENGDFFKSTQALHDNDPDVEQMLAEVRAQLERARRCGLDIAYMDTHMGFGWVAGVEEHLGELAHEEGLVYSPPELKRLPRTDGSYENPVEHLLASLDIAEPGTYLIVGHPAYDRVDVRAFDRTGSSGPSQGVVRNWQRRMFMDAEVLDYCKRHAVVPTRYPDV